MDQLDSINSETANSTSYDPSLPPDRLLAGWQFYVHELWSERLNSITARIWETASHTDGQSRLTPEVFNKAIKRHLGPGVIPDLLRDWETWSNSKARNWEAERFAMLEAAVSEYVPLPDINAYRPVESSNPYRWLAPCLGGGFLGLLVLGIGGGIAGSLGGLLGAAAGIAGVAYLSNNPAVLARTESGVATRSQFSRPAAKTSGITLLISQPTHWLISKGRSISVGLGARLVDFVLKSKVSVAVLPLESVAPAVERAFSAITTLVFLLCASRSDPELIPTDADLGLKIRESSVLHALTVLVRYLDKEPEDLETIRDMAQELQQRLQDAGYAWEIIADSSPFREEYRERFRLSGLIEPGQPVQTLVPCFRRGNEILLQGRITRQRG